MLSSESVTSSPTSIFWLTVGLLAFTVLLLVVAFFTWRSSIARKRLTLTIASRSRLLSAPEAIREDLQIKYKNDSIGGDPYVTAIELANTGKTHITSGEFDRDRALKFSLDATIIKHLSTDHSPSSAPTPVVTAENAEFSLAPELVARGEIIKIALLTQGRPTKVRTEFSPFGDVKIQFGDRESLESNRRRNARLASLSVLLILAVTVGFQGWLTAKAASESANTTQLIVNSGLCQELGDDSIAAIATLQVLIGNSEALPKSSDESAFIKFYDQTARLAESELSNTSQDYQRLGKLSAIGKNMISFTADSTKAAGEAATLNNVSSIVKFSGRLRSIQEGFLAKGALPSVCSGGGSSGKV